MLRSSLFFGMLLAVLTAFAQDYAEESVLSQGTWYKLGVVETGVYRLDQSFLNSIGINTSSIDPRNIRIYGNGGGMLPQENDAFHHDDLVENPIKVIGEGDGSFDNGDYVLFYGESAHDWEFIWDAQRFEHEYHLYSDTNYYYITVASSAGKRVESIPSASSPSYTVTQTRNFHFHEVESENLIHSGRFWVGEKFDLTLSRSYGFYMPDAKPGGETRLTLLVSARSDVNSQFEVEINGTVYGTLTLGPVNLGNSDAQYFQSKNNTLLLSNDLVSADDSLHITLRYNKSGSSRSEGWLEWIEVEYDQSLNTHGQGSWHFGLSEQVGAGQVAAFSIENGSSNYQIWDISDPVNAVEQSFSMNGNRMEFNVAADSIKQFIAFHNDFLVPASAASMANQNLHGISMVDYLVISYPGFLEQANRLAQFHEDHYQRSTAVVTPDEIYQEFSSGKADVSAIRNFIKMFYDRSGGIAPGFVVLFGDGSYNYKRINLPPGSEEINFVPTYQSCNSWDPTDSYTSDDFYGFMEAHEGRWGEACGRGGDLSIEVNTIDVPIGRLPVIDTTEARQMVDKIIRYANNPEGAGFGDWRNRILLVADHKEGEGNTHVSQADRYSSSIHGTDPCINLEKIYMDNYEMIKTAGVTRFPEGREALLNALDNGSLIVNYTGHGGEFAWSNSRILENSDINNLQNKDRLPAVITATCEFGRYDNPDLRSGAELMVLNPEAGAIALFTTVRLVYSNPNATLNSKFYEEVLQFDSLKGRMPSLGEVMMRTKNKTFVLGNFNNINTRNFTLLGDPGLILNYPEHKARITSINGEPVLDGSIDTLQSLGIVRVQGQVEDVSGNLLNNYSGDMDVTVYDKPSRFQTRLSNFSFFWQKNRIFNGKALVDNGEFDFSFVVPIDISYDDGLGKISLYFHNTEIDGSGCYNDLFVGGTDPNAIPDDEGPEIQLYMYDENWIDGSSTDPDPELYAIVYDESGINTAGIGIGHEITGQLDPEEDGSTWILNDYYEAKPNSYQEGTIRYQFRDLSPGLHRLRVRVWDVANNTSEAETSFIVVDDASTMISEILNYPNPFSDQTTFSVNHNQAGKELHLKIEVLSQTGQVVRILESDFISGSSIYADLSWDGTTAQGNPISDGLYLYRVQLTEKESGQVSQQSGRILLLR